MRPVGDVARRKRESDHLRRDLLAYIGHELKTPAGALTLLAETMATEDDPEVCRRLAERMLSEAQRMGRMIQDLLELSNEDAGTDSPVAGDEPAERFIPVRAIVADATDRVRHVAHARDVRLVVRSCDADATVDGSRRRLSSALGNLLENAVKYSHEHSVVTLGVTRYDGEVSFAVSDAGIGIEPSDRGRVFDRSFRASNARRHACDGSGLGLALVRHIVSTHGGDVRVTSEPGRGSTFVMSLPLAPLTVVL
jgi:two-component system sensor histidine kinase SenX3